MPTKRAPAPEPRSWAERARTIIRDLTAGDVLKPEHQGYADSLLAAGIALDLAEAAGQSGQVEYARRGWVASLQLMTPPPRKTPERKPEAEGVNNGAAESEFDRLARDFFGSSASGNPNVRDPA